MESLSESSNMIRHPIINHYCWSYYPRLSTTNHYSWLLSPINHYKTTIKKCLKHKTTIEKYWKILKNVQQTTNQIRAMAADRSQHLDVLSSGPKGTWDLQLPPDPPCRITGRWWATGRCHHHGSQSRKNLEIRIQNKIKLFLTKFSNQK